MASFDFFEFIRGVPPEVLNVLKGIGALLVVAVAYKVVSRYVGRVGERLEIDSHGLNSIRLIVRARALGKSF